jgi:hypothetical protein
MSIAILGWGSLLWEDRREFDRQHEQWRPDGPTLKIEFSRVSGSRDGALTLVLDDQFGSPMKVAWCLSKREGIEDAICDLRCREGTTLKNIGHVRVDAQHPPPADPPSPKDLIIAWAREKHLGAVIWTALKSNFQAEGRPQFTVEAAVAWLKELPPAGKAKAAEYVWRAPDFVQTPVRSALQGEPWFSEATSLAV